jgi:hypothetical protein
MLGVISPKIKLIPGKEVCYKLTIEYGEQEKFEALLFFISPGYKLVLVKYLVRVF